MIYRVKVGYTPFDFNEGEAALSFAEVANRHITEDVDIAIEFIREESEDGR